MQPADACQSLCIFARERTRVSEALFLSPPKFQSPMETQAPCPVLLARRRHGKQTQAFSRSPAHHPPSQPEPPQCTETPGQCLMGSEARRGASDLSGQELGPQARGSPSNSRRDHREPLDGLSLCFPICKMSCRLNRISGSQPGSKPESSN